MAAWDGSYQIAVPDHLLITIAKNKGVVLLAWDGEQPVGFTFSFPSFVDGEDGKRRLKHCSHMSAVLPSHRGRKIGEQLKWAQRQAVLAQGIDHITWTYDPLETRNGRLNLHKLGAVCNVYQRDVYGQMNDGVNAGLASDRFLVDWWLNSAHIIKPQQVDLGKIPALNQPKTHSIDSTLLGAPYLLATVPRDFQMLKSADLPRAQAWRQHTRNLFETAFAAGYTAIDLLLDEHYCHYLLTC